MMISQHIAMIGHKTYQRIVIHSFLFQFIHNTPYLLINESHRSIIILTGIPGIFHSIVPYSRFGILFGMGIYCKVFTPVTYHGSRYFSAFIHIHYSPGGIIRAMWTGKRYFQEQRLFRRITFYRLHRPVSCPYGRMQPFGQSIRFRFVGVPLHPRTVGIQTESLRTIITHKIRRLHTSAFIQNSRFESMQHILRMPMHLSYSQCVITQVFQHLWHFIGIMIRHLSIS